VADLALERGRLDIVARYLRESILPLVRDRERGRIHTTLTLYRLIDLLEGRGARRHEIQRDGAGNPNRRNIWRELHVGAEMLELMNSGKARKTAVLTVCKRYGIEQSQGYKLLAQYEQQKLFPTWEVDPEE
jgi:hypothetical protein